MGRTLLDAEREVIAYNRRAVKQVMCAVALLALSCARAEGRTEPAPAPAPLPASAPTPAPSAAPRPAPAPASAAVPAPPVSDRELLPCPGNKPFCEPAHPLVAAGVLDRAERYLAECRECRHRTLVEGTRVRALSVVRRLERERRRQEPKDCRAGDALEILVSPHSVVAGDKPRVVLAARAPFAPSIEIRGPGAPSVVVERSGGGPPWFSVLELAAVTAGEHRVIVRDGERVLGCQRFEVGKRRRLRFRRESLWYDARGWDRGAEDLYSAWVAQLFDAPEGKRWHGLGALTSDRERNFLHDHLGLGEDADPKVLALTPDCADAPYVFRAYFAWKLGLPFGRHECRFGEIDGPPRCAEWETNVDPFEDPEEPLRPASPRDFRELAERLKDEITARSLRTALSDDATDLYPVALEREHLRPGVVFSDPWGHTLTLVKWLPQTATRPGTLLAVDAQPDGTLGIRRFWRGNFLFVDGHPIGGFGFKAFRPIVLDLDGPRRLSNAEIAVARGYGGFSLAQARMDAAGFYATMARLVSPTPPPPEQELDALLDALMQQLERRVAEVNVAEELVAERAAPIEMPEGRAIFRTTGAWEAVSTPCRDLRLLVGMDALLAFPKQAARPDLERRLEQRAAERAIDYVRSDGSKQRLTLRELIARRARFEMAYNPNDCPELRWGAAEGSPEIATCKRRAPEHQRRRMQRMRHWFQKRYACG